MIGGSPNAVVAGFTDDQASRLTGVSVRQLRYWSANGFFVPSFDLLGDGVAIRLYSFRDLVCLRILNTLRNEAKIDFKHLREVKENLSHLGEDMWAKTTLYILNRRVVFENPDTGRKEDVGTGQGVLQIPLIVVSGDMEAAVRTMRQRQPADLGRIDASKASRKNPVVAGTRIPVRTIQEFAAEGFSIEQILGQYPTLTESDVRAALAHKLAA